MSVDEARGRVWEASNELGRLDWVADRLVGKDEHKQHRRDTEEWEAKLDAALDELIREVRAEMPCYRTTGQPRHDHGPFDMAITPDFRCLARPAFCEECGRKRDPCESCKARAEQVPA